MAISTLRCYLIFWKNSPLEISRTNDIVSIVMWFWQCEITLAKFIVSEFRMTWYEHMVPLSNATFEWNWDHYEMGGGGKADSKSINISSTTINAFFIFISCAFPRNRRRSQYRPFLWQYIMNLLWLCVFLSLSVCRSVHGMCMKFATKWVPWQQRDPTISSAHFGSRPKNVLSNHFANESRK